MNDEQFWHLIEASRGKGQNCEDQAAKLEELLVGFAPEEIIDFFDIFNVRVREANTPELWAISYIANGCSSERYAEFRFWLIGRGQEYFEDALENPDQLANQLKEDNCFCEQLGAVPSRAYKRVTGAEMYDVLEEKQSPSLASFLERSTSPLGTRWKNEEDLKARFPRLCEKFG